MWERIRRILDKEIPVLRMSRPFLRRQLEGTFYRELALGLRHHCPLDGMLEMIAQEPSAQLGRNYVQPAGLSLLVFILATLLFLRTMGFILAVLIIGVLLIAVFSLPRGRGDRCVRYVARRLAALIRQGNSLSEAMARLPRVFSRGDCRLVAIGEQTGNLAGTLEALAGYQALYSRMAALAVAFFYPFTVFSICLAMVTLIMVKIVPREVDIYRQMGMELPRLTMVIFEKFFGYWGFLFLLLVTLAFAAVAFIRRIRGHFEAGRDFLVVVALVAAAFAFPTMRDLWEANEFVLGFVVLAGAIIVAVGIGAVLRRFFRWAVGLIPEPVLQRLAQWIGWLIPLQQLRHSRFLLALGHGLRGQIPLPEALLMAGEAARGRLREEGRRLHDGVQKGRSLGDALKTSPSFTGRTVALLSLSEWRGTLADDCIDLAEEMHFDNERAIARLAMVVEWVALVVVGVVLGAFVLAVYMPLFKIPAYLGVISW